MPDMDLVLIIAIVFVVFALVMLHVFPSGKKAGMGKRKQMLRPQEQKDWKAAGLRMEKAIHKMRKEAFELHKTIKMLEAEKDIYKNKEAQLQEKLLREKGWQKKEEADLDKKHQQIIKLETALKSAEERLESEHAELLRLRRGSSDIQEQLEETVSYGKKMDEELAKAQALADNYRQEILTLRADNAKLSQKHEDTQWIAKSQHLKVKEELRTALSRLERLERERKRASSDNDDG